MNLSDYMSGSLEPWSVSVLQALVRITKPRRLLELGTFEGRTTSALASAMPAHAHLTTVEFDFHRFTSALARFDEDPRVTCIHADAEAFLRDSREMWDFVFVDDDHERAHVARELDLVLPKMARGGLVVGHDVVGPFGLREVFEERGGFVIELPLLHAAGSLGVIHIQ